MRGNPDSCGVWAPCLSYDDGTFYLVFSNVRSFDGVWKDTPSYLVTTDDILGDWSDPIFLSSTGFDGSMFHDSDGRKWFTSMQVDQRKGKFFGGIILQEYDTNRGKLIGPMHHIFEGTSLGITEAPHIYQRNGYYYLITAEGGTEYGHAVSLARSTAITGPYEVHPANPIISVRDHPDAPLQKCGHADLVETPDGEWFCVFLVGRPLTELGRCTLGRETAIEQVVWKEDDWLYLSHDGYPRQKFDIRGLSHQIEAYSDDSKSSQSRNDFDDDIVDINFQSLRIPMSDEWISLRARAGYLRLFGRQSLSSLHHQSLIARRVQHFNIEAATCVEFSPAFFQQLAGLVCYYNTTHWYYLNIQGGEQNEVKKKLLQITACDNYNMTDLLAEPIDITEADRVYLKVHFHRAHLQFYYATVENEWIAVGGVLDGSILSDDYVQHGGLQYRAAFTGAFVGICCQDLSGLSLHADFDWFEYRELN